MGKRLLAATLLIYGLCPPFTSFDSYWSVPTALSLIQHGSTTVDQWADAAPPMARRNLECVAGAGPAARGSETAVCVDGHWYNYFPAGVSVLAAPPVFVLKMVASAVAALFPTLARHVSQPALAAFLAGDLFLGHVLVELWCAALFGALTVWLVYSITRRFLAERAALGLTLLFAFGTSEWSVASRNLYQQGLTALLLAAALWIGLRAQQDARWIQFLSIPLALAFTVRPSNAVAVAVLTLFVAVHYRAWLWRYLLWALPVAVPFLAYNWLVRHSLLQNYFLAPPVRYPAWEGLAMHLVSPSRGLFVFTPVLLFSIAGMALAWRTRWCFPLAPWLMAILLLHTAVIASVWEGHSFGPRYYADVGPLFLFFLIPAYRYWEGMRGAARRTAAAAFLLFAAWGIFVHGRGATSTAVQEWNVTPAAVDGIDRVWDWRDPQFLRGL
jgi:Dolichyl-phosphate-mannose-protein mannosyltransferase